MRVREGEAFPADLMLVQSSSNDGVCTIETSNLDGETNLKVKQAERDTYEVPCVVSYDMSGGLAAYTQWIDAQTTAPRRTPPT